MQLHNEVVTAITAINLADGNAAESMHELRTYRANLVLDRYKSCNNSIIYTLLAEARVRVGVKGNVTEIL